jgi:hypothetical protein
MARTKIGSRRPVLVAAVVGLLSLGVAGAAGTWGTAGAARVPRHVHCAKVEARLAHMRHRQAAVTSKLARLTASASRAAKDGSTHRAAHIERALAHERWFRSRVFGASFLHHEAALSAAVAERCPGAPSSAA